MPQVVVTRGLDQLKVLLDQVVEVAARKHRRATRGAPRFNLMQACILGTATKPPALPLDDANGLRLDAVE